MKSLKTPGVVGGPVELHLIEKDLIDIPEENTENEEENGSITTEGEDTRQ